MENRRLCQLFQGRKKHTHTLKAPDANEGEGAVNSFQPWPPPKKKSREEKQPRFPCTGSRNTGISGKLFPPLSIPFDSKHCRLCSLPALSRSFPDCLCIRGFLVPRQIHRPGEQDPIPAAPAASSWRSHPCLCPSVSHRAPRSCTFWDSGGAGAVGRCPCLPQPGCSHGRARSGGSVGSVLGSSRCRRSSRGTADSLELRFPALALALCVRSSPPGIQVGTGRCRCSRDACDPEQFHNCRAQEKTIPAFPCPAAALPASILPKQSDGLGPCDASHFRAGFIFRYKSIDGFE